MGTFQLRYGAEEKVFELLKQCCHEKKVGYLQNSQNAIVNVGGMSDLGHEAPKSVS